MNNSSLTCADSATHLKVVVVSLVAAIFVVGVGILAKPDLSLSVGTTSSQLEASGPIIRAGKPTATAGTPSVIR